MDKKRILEILEGAKDDNGEIPMSLVRKAFEKIEEPCADAVSRQLILHCIDGRVKSEDSIYATSALRALGVIVEKLPSAQPEIIHCGDCRYKDDGIDEDGIPFLKCLHGRSYGGTRINDFCSWAERRTDEDD